MGDPRNVLQKVMDEAAEMGFGFNVGPECEFFLFKLDENGNPTLETGDEGGYFDLNPIDHGENCRRDICLALEDMGYTIEASHHEVAEGQHEIDFKYAEALTAAGLPAHCEFWGSDVSHDWYWWGKELNLFAARVFG